MIRQTLATLAMLAALAAPALAGPYADSVVYYDRGDLAVGDYDNPNVTLGSPSRTTAAWPVGQESTTMLVTPWEASQVCKIGNDGQLVVSFSGPVENDAANPFGLDLLVFMNAGFGSADWPANQHLTDPAFIYGGQLGRLSVSQDNATWFEAADLGLVFPTQGYRSGAANAYAAGFAPTDFTRPVDPSLTVDDFSGLSLTQALALYGRSGGGLGVDLSNLLDSQGQAASLDWIRYVKIEGQTNAVDGFSDVAVPEPASMALLAMGLSAMVVRRRKAR